MSDDEKPPGRAPVSSIPVTWSQGAMSGDGAKIKGKSLVVTPNEREAAIFSSQILKTCASCRHYKQAVAQKEFHETKGGFFKQLVHEMGWKLRHLGSHPRELARCGQKDDLLVGPHSKACEWHKGG